MLFRKIREALILHRIVKNPSMLSEKQILGLLLARNKGSLSIQDENTNLLYCTCNPYNLHGLGRKFNLNIYEIKDSNNHYGLDITEENGIQQFSFVLQC